MPSFSFKAGEFCRMKVIRPRLSSRWDWQFLAFSDTVERMASLFCIWSNIASKKQSPNAGVLFRTVKGRWCFLTLSMQLLKREGWSDCVVPVASEPELLGWFWISIWLFDDMMRNDYDSTSILEGLHFDQDFPKHYCPDSWSTGSSGSPQGSPTGAGLGPWG